MAELFKMCFYADDGAPLRVPQQAAVIGELRDRTVKDAEEVVLQYFLGAVADDELEEVNPGQGITAAFPLRLLFLRGIQPLVAACQHRPLEISRPRQGRSLMILYAWRIQSLTTSSLRRLQK